MTETAIQTQEPVVANTLNISTDGFINQLQEATLDLAKTIAEKHDLPEDSVIDCIPEEMKIKTINLKAPQKAKKPKKAKVEKITDYRQAESLEDLKIFKLDELKNICQENKLSITGAKPILMKRVWSINHPEDCPEEPVAKKKGRKPKDASQEKNDKEKKPRKSKKKEEIVEPPKTEDSNTEENSCNPELDPENMEDICIDDDGNITDNGRNLKIFEKKWIFEDDDESMEFVGVLENEEKVTFLNEPPEELLKIINNE